MMMRVDAKSYELAEHFMSDMPGATKADIQSLAEDIQRACEDACADVERRLIDESFKP